jgi:hypothetical protein
MTGTMLRRGALGALVLVLAFGGVGGCDEDEEPGGALPVFDVRNGTWATTTTTWATGPDSCAGPPQEEADTLVACVFDPFDAEGGSPFPNFQCDVSQDGDEVAISCSGSITDFCTEGLVLEGSGRISESEVDLTLSAVWRYSGPDPCPVYVSACTLWVEYAGTWISAEGDSQCEGGSAAAAAHTEPLFTGWKGGILSREGASR